MQPLLFDEIAKVVNSYINKVNDLELFNIANKVYKLDWEFFNVRNIVRADGDDIGRHSAVNRFYKLYNTSKPNEIVGIYNFIHKTEYEFDNVCNILKVKSPPTV